MTPERWQQVDQVFQAAIELKAEDRRAFLESACANDVELRREVEALITADEQGLSFVDGPALPLAAGFLSAREPELAEGQSLSHYEIVGLLGRGGMGEVYLAMDTLLNRRVALKLLPTDYTRNKNRLRRFQREAQTASALNHPNILTIYELGEVCGQQFIATEFVEGETLRQHMRRVRLNLAEALDIALQTAGALAAAHKAGIVHRDIKPENIMLRPDGYVKVLDFGLAKLTEQDERTTEVQVVDDANISSGLIMGTVKYMSPEQAKGLSVDSRSDIFSLGVVLYEMIAGRVPFEGRSAPELVAAILERDPPPLTDFQQDVPEDLKRIVGNVLSKERGKRYQTFEALIVDLKSLRQQVEPASRFQPLIVKSDRVAVSLEDKSQDEASSIGSFIARVREHKAVAAAAMIGLVFLLGSVQYLPQGWLRRSASLVNESKTRILTTTGHVMDPAISADGNYVAFRSEDAGLFSLRIRELSTNTEKDITPPEERPVLNPVFTPDGRFLYYEFLASSGFPARQLYRRPVLGGREEKIVDYLTSKVSFSPDGSKLAFIRLDALVVANADGREERSIITLTEPDYFPEHMDGSLSWAPDGKRIVYTAQIANDGYQRIFEVDLDTKLVRPLTSQKWGAGIASATWLPDSSGILFKAANTSISNAVWRLSYPGGGLQRLTNDANKYIGLSVASDSNTLVTIQVADYWELWIAPDADAARARRVMPARHDGRYGFAWTPDGKIVYTREANENSDIWMANADGTNQRQLTTDVHQDRWPTVTADGRYVVFQSDRVGADHIWRMDTDGGNQMQLTFGKIERRPVCSPDSKWVLYTAWETGKPTVWKVPVAGGPTQQLTDLQCGSGGVSHNGKLRVCGSGLGGLLIVPFEGGKPVATVQLPEGAHWDGSWTLDDRAIRYITSNPRQNYYQMYGTSNWWIQPIDGSSPRQLTFFKRDQPGATSLIIGEWSPDGKDLLYLRKEWKSDLVMMTGFK